MEPDISYYLPQNRRLMTITRNPEEIDPKTFKFSCLFYQGKFETVFEMFSYQVSSSALLGLLSPDFVATTTLFHVKKSYELQIRKDEKLGGVDSVVFITVRYNKF